MKNYSTIFAFMAVSISLLLATGCSKKDSEFYNDVFISVPNLVNAEVNVTDPTNKMIYVNASISRYLNVAGQAHPLDIYKTTSGATKLDFTYELEEEINGTWTKLDIMDNQLQIEKGEALGVGYVFASCVYNDTSKAYEFRTAIKGLTPGNYHLSFGYNSTSTTDVELRSESIGNNLFLNLNSPYSALDVVGNYAFTIN